MRTGSRRHALDTMLGLSDVVLMTEVSHDRTIWPAGLCVVMSDPHWLQQGKLVLAMLIYVFTHYGVILPDHASCCSAWGG